MKICIHISNSNTCQTVRSISKTLSLKSIGLSLKANTRPTLKSIVLYSEVGQWQKFNPLRGLDHALQEIAGRNVLVELQVVIVVESFDGCDTDSGDFPNLDTVLTEAGAFPKLRRVSLEVAWGLDIGFVKSESSSDYRPPYQLQRFQFLQLCRCPTIDFSCSKKY